MDTKSSDKVHITVLCLNKLIGS